MKEISLSKGKIAIVDDEDYRAISRWKWVYSKGYARRFTNPGSVLMHRQILEAPAGKLVDHVNGDGLDNRRHNLRICSYAENVYNSAAHKDSLSGLKGASYQKTQIHKKWRSRIRVNGKTIFLGLYKTAEEAHEAYKKAARAFHGEFTHKTLK